MKVYNTSQVLNYILGVQISQLSKDVFHMIET